MSVDRWRIASQLLFWRCRSLCREVVLLACLELCRDVRFNQQINLVRISVLWWASVVLIVVLWPMQFDTCDAVFG